MSDQESKEVPATPRLDDLLGPLPDSSYTLASSGGFTWVKGYSAEHMRAERARCYALGVAAAGLAGQIGARMLAADTLKDYVKKDELIAAAEATRVAAMDGVAAARARGNRAYV